MFNTFSKIYKWLKIIIMEILYPKLGIINGSIGYIKNVLHRFWMDIKKCYNASTHKCCSEFEQFHRKYIKLQNIKLQGFLKNVIPIIPISRSFQYHHHISKLDTCKRFIINRYQLPFAPTFCFTYFKTQGPTFNNLIIDLWQPFNNITTRKCVLVHYGFH
jgi:hypothetical protein